MTASSGLVNLFERVDRVWISPPADDALHPILSTFDRLRIPAAAVADALGVTEAAASQWRSGRRPIPRDRRIQMLAFLVNIGMRFELLAKMTDSPRARAGLLRDAKAIDQLLIAETRRKGWSSEDRERFFADVEIETARVRQQLEPVWREMDRQAGRTRQ